MAISPGVTSVREGDTKDFLSLLHVLLLPLFKSSRLCKIGLPPPMVEATSAMDLAYAMEFSTGSVRLTSQSRAKFEFFER